MSESISFEKALAEIQQIVKRMESGELSLEDSLQHFERGVQLTRLCQEQLLAAEKRVDVLVNAKTDIGVAGPKFEPFNN